MDYKNIEIINDKNGVPRVNIVDNEFNNFDIKLSLSHDKEAAIAFALIVEK